LTGSGRPRGAENEAARRTVVAEDAVDQRGGKQRGVFRKPRESHGFGNFPLVPACLDVLKILRGGGLLEAQEIAGHGSPDGRDMHLEARTSGRGLLVAVRIVVIVEKIPTEYPTSEFPSRILVGARMIDRTAFPAGTIEDGCSDAIAGFEAVERDAQGREGLGQGADPAIGHAPRGIEQVSKGCRGVSPRLLRLGLDAPRGVSPSED